MLSTTCIAEVPYKKNGTSAQFFEDHLRFNDKIICYDDIAELTTSGLSTRFTFLGIPVGKGFDGGAVFKLSNGQKHKIIMNAFSPFGIPIIRNARVNEQLYPALYEALFNIVARRMAQRWIHAIRNGATVEVAGLTIKSTEAVAQTKITKTVTVINRANYLVSQHNSGGGVTVQNKAGETLWGSSPLSYKNTLLIPYILDALFV